MYVTLGRNNLSYFPIVYILCYIRNDAFSCLLAVMFKVTFIYRLISCAFISGTFEWKTKIWFFLFLLTLFDLSGFEDRQRLIIFSDRDRNVFVGKRFLENLELDPINTVSAILIPQSFSTIVFSKRKSLKGNEEMVQHTNVKISKVSSRMTNNKWSSVNEVRYECNLLA